MHIWQQKNWARCTIASVRAARGVFCSWEGNEQQAIPLYYEQVCGLLNGERNKQLGAMEKWDFQKFQPDVIVVNLGTNDSSGTKNMDRVGKAVEDFFEKTARM